jgi:hypothetical protein
MTKAQASSGAWKDLPENVRVAMTNPAASRGELEAAARAAEGAGYPQLAQALRKRAESAGLLIPSPWKDVTSAKWTRFCAVMAIGKKPTFINEKGFFGLFQLSVRRLCDLGVMTSPKSRNTPAGRIWEGEWIISKEKFLTDPTMQYELFGKSLDLYRNIIAEKYKQVLGLNIEGQPATLSGLLALCHTAGSEGMYKWLTEKTLRTKFTWVTEAYNRANEIF